MPNYDTKKTMFVFPGQGSQTSKMGKELYDKYNEAKEVFQEVDNVLNYKLSDIIFGDDYHKLSSTEHTQPALMTVSIAILRILLKKSGKNIENLCQVVAGHSLGEYSALCAAKSISLSDTAKVLYVRGTSMNDAAPNGIGGMIVLLGATTENANDIVQDLAENDTLVIANDNSIGQIVLSGHMSAINRVVENHSKYGIKRAIKLPVSGPFHSPLMKGAANNVRNILNDIEIKEPIVQFIANVSASYVSNPNHIRSSLVSQVTNSVRWRESIEVAANEGIEYVFEIGSGNILSNLTKRIASNIQTTSISTDGDIDAFCEIIST